ncbi:NADP-dependent oxidoreductase [Gordonia sp. (in: high G+C Gram-positive bacteria)]|uniref:NADP-dependent oxidoreductase n=1 Tax=Gordonia sp. (in: high G+C Gram-positive bacteria) TaxID=84139 RepID=UPI003C77227A
MAEKTPATENPETPATTARKITATAYGEPSEVLEVAEVEIPRARRGTVVVQVRAAGLNPYDVKVVRGQMGTKEENLPLSLGGEAAGVVHAAGADSGFRVGDEVVVYPASGALAEYVSSSADNVHSKPAGLGFDVASSVLLAGVAAIDTLATLSISEDDVLLVHGGSGSVGSIVVSEALASGAKVIATASPRNHEHLSRLGAIPVAYGEGLAEAIDAARGDQAVTAVIDTVGSDEAIDVSLQLVKPHRIVSLAAFGRSGDGIVVLDGSSEQSKHFRRSAIEPLLEDAAAKRITVEIARRFGFDDAAEAFEELAGSHPRGKLIFNPRA